ncbi:reverse transcriptase domain-containing protein [Tanacetum coccineum]
MSGSRYRTSLVAGGTSRVLESDRSKNLLQQISAIRGTLFLNCPEFRMTGPTPDPTIPEQSPSLMFQQTLDGPTRGWFDRMPNGCIDSWANLREKFVERFSLRRRCSKDPTEVSKIVRRANETLPNFKERWTEEMGYIKGVLEVMQISAFMTNSKCPELARRFADQVPQTVTKMMKHVDDFVNSEEAFKSTELPRGSFGEGTG